MPSCASHWPFPACSYGGECDTTLGRCICKPAFLERGDMFPWPGYDCVVPKYVVLALYTIALVLALFNLLRRLSAMRRLTRQRKARAAKPHTGSGHDTVMRLHTLSLMQCALQVSMCIAFVASPSAIVGEDVAKSVLLAACGMLCYYCIFETCAYFAKTTAQLTTLLHLTIPSIRRFVRLSKPPYIILCLCTFVIAPLGGLWKTQTHAWLYMHLCGAQLLGAYIFVLLHVSSARFLSLLQSQSAASPVTHVLRARILTIRRVGFLLNFGFQFGITLILVWPWARSLVPMMVASVPIGTVSTETILFKVLDTRATQSRAAHTHLPPRGSTVAVAPSTNASSGTLSDHDASVLSTAPKTAPI